MIRSKKIMQSARGEDCLCRTPDCNNDPHTTVCAHSNQHYHGKGLGIKAHDIFVAYACSACHAYIDFYKDGWDGYWERGHARTLVKLVEKGIVKIL